MSLMYIEVLVSQKANKPCMRLVLQRIEEMENTKKITAGAKAIQSGKANGRRAL
jgi:hypothetical protein